MTIKELIENDLPVRKPPILCIDFDGVLHSYTSGWKGPRCIPDSPVPGAIEWLDSLVEDGESVCALAPRFRDFDVCIFSSRRRYWGGKKAILNWLVKHGFPKDKCENIRFPFLKPPAFILIDDRALTFNGNFPTVEQIKSFKPWNRLTQHQCPTCGYYCLGKGGQGCIDKPGIVAVMPDGSTTSNVYEAFESGQKYIREAILLSLNADLSWCKDKSAIDFEKLQKIVLKTPQEPV